VNDDQIQSRLKSADASLQEARALIDAQMHPAAAMNHLYYAMFNALAALIEHPGLSCQSHPGLSHSGLSGQSLSPGQPVSSGQSRKSGNVIGTVNHSELLNVFIDDFVTTGVFDETMADAFFRAFEFRRSCDCTSRPEVLSADVDAMLPRAENFVAGICEYLRTNRGRAD
jgi:uncharacterized protein (UPF0332 family)